MLPLTALAAALLTGGAALAQDQQPSPEEMWRIIQQQQQEIESLKSRQSETDEKVEAAGERIEEVAAKEPAGGGMVEGWWNRTSVGGYGEMHYNGGSRDEIDFHRFVLFFGHQFSDRIRFFSELELEHSLAGDSEPGEVELEQAFVEFDISDRIQARAGLFLLPVGILNETHEPPTFFGVERNIVETNIIPTTWWEGGVGGRAVLGRGFSADLAVHSGLSVDTTTFLIRGGRQKVAEAPAEDPAITGRIKWTGMPGVELAFSAQYQDDLTQGVLDIDATLLETHANIRRGPWSLRALYARWDLGGDQPRAVGRDEQYGWYVEPGYIFTTGKGEVGVFARYSEADNTVGDSTDSKLRQTDVGLNYWPHPQVVLKADYQFQSVPAGMVDDDRV
ncbi:MAG: porin, partial [Gammaproteobacteria bacterium]